MTAPTPADMFALEFGRTPALALRQLAKMATGVAASIDSQDQRLKELRAERDREFDLRSRAEASCDLAEANANATLEANAELRSKVRRLQKELREIRRAKGTAGEPRRRKPKIQGRRR